MKVNLSNIQIDNNTKKAVLSVLDSKKFILGKETEKFEVDFDKFCGVKYAACVSSGTAALFLTLQHFGVKKGDEVILPSMSYIATSTPVSLLGAKPKFVDVNYHNYTIDPSKIEKNISKKTKVLFKAVFHEIKKRNANKS